MGYLASELAGGVALAGAGILLGLLGPLAGRLLLPAISVPAGGGGVRGFAMVLVLPAYSLLPQRTPSTCLSTLSGQRALCRRAPYVRASGWKTWG